MKTLPLAILLLITTIHLKAQTMEKTIYPCIWFDHNAKEAVGFYQDIFDEVNILSENSTALMFTINGTKFMGLNGGDQFQPNAAVSYSVYCDGDGDKVEKLYNRLKEGGFVLMPLEKYDFSEKYAWVQDKYGVNWQLDIDPINHIQKIVPALLFTDDKSSKLEEATKYYTTAFQNSKEVFNSPFPLGSDMPEGSWLFSQFQLESYLFNAVSGGPIKHGFDFTEGNSFVVECNTQEEIDHYWNYFSSEGKESMCGWIQDKYGVWWQIIPAELKELMNTPEKAQKVSEAFLKMKKIDIEILRTAANN